MQPTRIFIRSPCAISRVAKPATAARTMSLFSSPPFAPRFLQPTFPAFPTFTNELAPFFRLMEDLTTTDHFSPPARLRTFQPRFDVREVGESYELRGELPGVEGKDLEVEFTDAQTLVIRGRTESERTSGTPPQAASVAQAIKAKEPETTMSATATDAVVDNDDAVSTHSVSSYQKPSVEDEGAAEGSASSTPGQATPAESTTSEAPQQQTVQTVAAPTESAQPQANSARYWVSERSTGSFQRVFNFPTRVNQDGVTASLKNGILNVVVPKAVAPTMKRIVVE